MDRFVTETTLKPCPICGKAGLQEWKPFCSKRCADVDLGRWLKGSYAIPVAAEDDEAERIADDPSKDV